MNLLKRSMCIEMQEAFILTMPILCAFIPLGMGLGYITQQLGLEYYLVIIMAMLIYAGSAEFIIAIMFAKSATYVDIVIAALLCNLRHIFYGLSVHEKYPAQGLKRWFMIFALSDESYAILSSTNISSKNTAFYICLFNYLYWVIGVIIGIIICRNTYMDIEGLEFILTALFVILTIEQAHILRRFTPFMIAIIAYSISLISLPYNFVLLGAIGLSVLFLIVEQSSFNYRFAP